MNVIPSSIYLSDQNWSLKMECPNNFSFETGFPCPTV